MIKFNEATSRFEVDRDAIAQHYERMHAPWARGAIWLINQVIEPELKSLSKGPD